MKKHRALFYLFRHHISRKIPSPSYQTLIEILNDLGLLTSMILLFFMVPFVAPLALAFWPLLWEVWNPQRVWRPQHSRSVIVALKKVSQQLEKERYSSPEKASQQLEKDRPQTAPKSRFCRVVC